MAQVQLNFTPPIEEGIVALLVFESVDPDAGYSLVDTHTSVGTYPGYINSYTTQNAVNVNDWFAIAWQDAQGNITPISEPVRGNTTTLVGEIMDRVLLRSPDLDENIVYQETLAVISYVYGTDDPFSIDVATVSELWKVELANLALVSTLYVVQVEHGTSAQSYTAGIISESSNSGSSIKDVLDNLERLEKRSLKKLGIGGSLVATYNTLASCLTLTGVKENIDSSRVLSARAIITESFIAHDLETGQVY